MAVFVGFPENKRKAYGDDPDHNRKDAGVASKQNHRADSSR
jgi:hypothetical protein